jgi:serine/threonine protein kinase
VPVKDAIDRLRRVTERNRKAAVSSYSGAITAAPESTFNKEGHVVSQKDVLDWSGRGNHVNYGPHDHIPLDQGIELGRGANGLVNTLPDGPNILTYSSSVYRTVVCGNIPVAWKRIRCQKAIGPQQMKEIQNMKKLDHLHIVRLMGSYTHRRDLGILIWPVATCDLGALMNDMDAFLDNDQAEPLDADFQDEDRYARLGTIIGRGADFGENSIDICSLLKRRLEKSLGCLASAINYLHSGRINIRHKDIKPTNVLLSHNGLWRMPAHLPEAIYDRLTFY